MNYLVGYYSDIGRKNVNQDGLLIKTAKINDDNLVLCIACDGLGGLNSGEVASATAINAFSNWFDNEKFNIASYNIRNITNIVKQKVFEVNNKIIDYATKINSKIGTTFTLFLSINNEFLICQIGDSRVYKVNDEVCRLTVDQTFVQRELERGILNELEAKSDKRRNVLLQCVGVKSDIDPVFSYGQIDIEDIYIICTDGFYKKIEEYEIRKEFVDFEYRQNNDLTFKVESIIDRAKSRGEKDNLSAIAIKFL